MVIRISLVVKVLGDGARKLEIIMIMIIIIIITKYPEIFFKFPFMMIYDVSVVQNSLTNKYPDENMNCSMSCLIIMKASKLCISTLTVSCLIFIVK